MKKILIGIPIVILFVILTMLIEYITGVENAGLFVFFIFLLIGALIRSDKKEGK